MINLQPCDSTVQQPNSVKFGSLPAYLAMEGVAQKNQLEFDYHLFAGGYNEPHFQMCFPTKDVQLPLPKEDSSSNTLEGFDEVYPSICQDHWRQYIHDVVQHCDDWSNRWSLPEHHLIPTTPGLIAGVLQVDRKILQASSKRLFGRFIDEKSTLVTEDELRTIGFALWNPYWKEYKNGDTWDEFVDGLNRRHAVREQQKARREADLSNLLTELTEVQ